MDGRMEHFRDPRDPRERERERERKRQRHFDPRRPEEKGKGKPSFI